MSSQTQQAIFITEVAKPLQLGTRAIPEPPAGYVLIKVLSTQLLPHDTYGRDLGLFVADRLPFILGTNISGTVVKLGPEVTKLTVGDNVFGLGNPFYPTPDMSGLQQYALLSEEASAKVPKHLTTDDAASFPVNAVTSFSALFHPTGGFGFPAPFPDDEEKEDLSNETLLIIGGGSNVGRLAIQYAKLAGVGKIITIASASNKIALKAAGATHIIDRHQSEANIKTAIEVISPGGATRIYDCVSWDYTFSVSLLSSTAPSTLLALHPAEGAIEEIKKRGLEGTAKAQFVLGNSQYMQPLTASFWKALPDWIEEGALGVSKYSIIEGLDLNGVEKGLDAYRDGSPVVPVVVRPWGKA